MNQENRVYIGLLGVRVFQGGDFQGGNYWVFKSKGWAFYSVGWNLDACVWRDYYGSYSVLWVEPGG